MENGKENAGGHHMGWRSAVNDYSRKGLYHITIKVADRSTQVLGTIVGDADLPVGHKGAARVELTPLGAIVQHELLHSITAHYPMVRVDAFVVMPDHLHVIFDIRERLVSASGREAHLGQLIAGFKKGCNRRYWELTGMEAAGTWQEERQGKSEEEERRGKPAAAERGQAGEGAGGRGQAGEGAGEGERRQAGGIPAAAGRGQAGGGAGEGERGQAGGGAGDTSAATGVPLAAVCPQPSHRPPSRGTTGRAPLFSPGYVDVMPLREGQLQQQRDYIRQNPRSRLLRSNNRVWLQTKRASIGTALSLTALRGFLQRECAPWQITAEIWTKVEGHLLNAGDKVSCDSYGNLGLLERSLLPVVCHRRDRALFERQKARCLEAARAGAVLVSARIAKGEQEIMDAAIAEGWPVVLIADNGMPDIYHPSTARLALCAAGRLLIVTPWRYAYRSADDSIYVAACKTMNCLAQALCRTRDDWWR